METQSLTRAPVGRARHFGPAHRWRVLAAGVAANASFSAAAAGIPTTAIWMRADYHLGNATLGLVLGAIGLGVGLSELPWGVATDRFGDRPVLVAGLASTALALIAMALFLVPSANAVPALALFVTAMAAVGLLGGSVNGSSGRAIMSWFREGERGLAMSIRQTAVPLGGAIGAVLLPWLAATHGFVAVFGALAFLCGASCLLAWRWVYEPPQAHAAAKTPASTKSGPLADPVIWRLALGIGLLCVPQFAVLTFATVFLHDFAQLGRAGISGAMAAVQVGAMVMRVWSGRHTDKHGNRRSYLRGSALVAGSSFVAMAAISSLGHACPVAGLVALLVFAGICVSAWHGVAYAELATLAGPARAGTALGMANTACYLGLFLVPLAIPHLLAASSWAGVWFVSGLVPLFVRPLFPRPSTGRPASQRTA